MKYPDHARFLALRQRIPEVEALREAQGILIKCGAISYCIDRLLCRYREAQSVSSSMKLVHSEKINAILEELIVPVWRLFEMAEKQSPGVFIDV